MTNMTDQQHAEAVEQAAKTFNEAVAAADASGLTVGFRVQPRVHKHTGRIEAKVYREYVGTLTEADMN